MAAAAWGVLGVVALLVRAIVRLWPIAIDGFAGGLSPWQWAVAALWIGGMAYFEGYRGFQRSFAPRVAARAAELAAQRRLLPSLLAPLHVMSLIYAERRRLIASWGVLLGIIALVVLVGYLEQPWRGIIDAGVIVGLLWGVAALTASVWARFAARRHPAR